MNGRLSPELSALDPGQPGVEIASLREILRAQPARIEPWLGRVATGRTGVFADLNAAFAEDGAVVFLAPGTVLKEPVLVAHLSAGNGAPAVSYLRTLVVAGPGSECRVVESFASPAGRPSLTNAVTEVVVEDNAFVDRYKLQQEGADALHVATLAARLGRDARFTDHSIALGAALSRNDIDVRFEAEGGECALNGLFVVDGRRVADTHSRIDHAKPHCSSRQLYKGIVDGQGRGIFNGLVVVRPGAQKTDAWQMNKNLLLSREALAHSTPQLQILADDVKCKHGSTTGQLDANALFYLRSRGIGEARGPEPPHLGLRQRPRPEDGDRAAAPGGRAATAGAAARHRGPRGGAVVSGRPEAGALAAFDVEAVRREFPILRETVHGKPLVYLDSAASAQKPQAVIDAERQVYERSYANIHRGVHHLSMLATDAYETARAKVQRFLGAAESREIVLLRGTTEAVNLVAQAYGREHVGAGDEVLITGLEHHSNIVPWQLLCEEKGAKLRVAPIDDAGEVDMAAFERLLSPRTRIVSVAHVSNALGTINPVRRMTELGHAAGAVVVVDGAQAAPHLAVDVRAIGCDFYAFSGHKVYGPSGVGALYGRAALLEAMPPWQGGGDMIASVTFEKSTWNELPYKLEAGTPNIAGTIALGAAIDWVERVGLDAIATHEDDLLRYGTSLWRRSPGCGSSAPRARRRASSPSSSTASTRTTWGRSSTTRGSRCARATTARSRSWTATASPPPRAPRSPASTRARSSTPSPAASARSRRCSDDSNGRGARTARRARGRLDGRSLPTRLLPGADPGPLQAPPELPRDEGGEPEGERPQPALRRPGDRLPPRRGRRRARRELRGLGLLDLDRIGLDDDGRAQGKDGGRGRGPLRAVPRPRDRGPLEGGHRLGRARQARRLRRGPRVSGAGEVRVARLAHDEGRPRGRRQGLDGVAPW